MSTVTFTKQCKCQSQSSSPALVFSCGSLRVDGRYLVTAKMYPMACDACGTPWKEVRAAPTEEGKP